MNASPPRILIAEDDLANQQALRRLLEDCGAHIATASDGIHAMELLADESYHLVLMDVHMPRMNGIETTRTLRAKPGEYFRKLPIVAYTSDGSPENRANATAAGMTAFLVKPSSPVTLLSLLQQYVGPLQLPEVDRPFDKLATYTEGDKDFEAELRQLFVNNITELRAGAARAAAGGALEEFRYTQHKCKTTLSILDDVDALRALTEFRRALDQYDSAQIPIPAEALANLEAQCDQLVRRLNLPVT